MIKTDFFVDMQLIVEREREKKRVYVIGRAAIVG
jgi:hypothetical protein